MAEHIERVNTVDTMRGDVEIGVTDALAKHFSRHPVERKPVSQRRLEFEHRRPRWLRECAAEATGVFFYVYPGIAATANFILHEGNTAFSSTLQIGLAYAIGIAFAIIVCAPTSGGHFNPAVTVSLAVWQGFPIRKVPYYILSQIFGAFIAGLIMVGQYWEQLSAYAAQNVAQHGTAVFNGGAASALCTIPGPTQTNLGYLLFIEFFVDSFIAIVIWANLDPANPFTSPTTAPYTIGLVYATMVWGFADISISTNLARDLGTRIVAAIFYGGEVFTYNNYSWIAILINIPATLFGTGYYELVMRDSLQKIGKGAAIHEDGEDALHRYVTREGILKSELGYMDAVGKTTAVYTK